MSEYGCEVALVAGPKCRPSPLTTPIKIVARLVAAASGTAGDGSALGAIETAARWWGSGLASATVKPDTVALKSVSPLVLDTIGRSLCRSGEALFVIDVRSGRVRLSPTASWTVLGSDDPESWVYLVTLNGPSTGRTIKVPAASVLHVRYAPHPDRPWAGRSPMMMAYRHSTGSRTARNGHKRRIELHAIAAHRASKKRERLRNCRHAQPRDYPEDRERICRAYPYRRFCHSG